jgi:hypothetical protein
MLYDEITRLESSVGYTSVASRHEGLSVEIKSLADA